MKAFVNVLKVKYQFKDGNEIQGLEFNLAPKVKKFIPITKDNADLMRIMHNDLIEWYNRAEFGEDIILEASIEFDRTYNPSENDSSVHVNVL